MSCVTIWGASCYRAHITALGALKSVTPPTARAMRLALIAIRGMVTMFGDNGHVVSLLHDTVEDTPVTIELIDEYFGTFIADCVAALTDPPLSAGNRKKRKQMVREKLANANALVQTVKVADLIDNTPSILKHDPDFAVLYMQEKRELLQVLTKADSTLRQQAIELLADATDRPLEECAREVIG